MKNYMTTLIFLGMFAVTISAQKYTRIEDTDVLEKEKKVLMEKFPKIMEKAAIMDIYRINEKYSMVAYMKEDVYHESIVNSDRKDMLLVETARHIPQNEVPAIVMDVHKDSEYGTQSVKDQFIVQRPSESEIYRLDVAKEGSDEVRTIYYSKTGRMAKKPF